MNSRHIVALIIAVTGSIIVLAISSAYSSYVASTNHHNSCARTDLILDTFHDVLALALTPQKPQHLTAAQAAAVNAFKAEAYARIDQARC